MPSHLSLVGVPQGGGGKEVGSRAGAEGEAGGSGEGASTQEEEEEREKGGGGGRGRLILPAAQDRHLLLRRSNTAGCGSVCGLYAAMVMPLGHLD